MSPLFDVGGFLIFLSTSLLVVVTYFLFKATKQMASNAIMPRIVPRDSTEQERFQAHKNHLEQEKFKLKQLNDDDFVRYRGIALMNVGMGPAVNGRIWLITKDGEEEAGYFYSVPQGGRYLYPSADCPEIFTKKLLDNSTEFTFRAKYEDLRGEQYELKKTRVPFRY